MWDPVQGAARDAGGPERQRRLLRRLGIDFYPGEALPAILLFVCFFLGYAFQYAAKSVRQSTFIDALGAERLPWVYLLVALCSYPLLRMHARLADRLSRHATIAATCGVVGAGLALFWWLYRSAWAWVPLVFYIWVTILFVLVSSQLWSYANHLFEARQAKRLFGFIGAGGLLGSVAGGQIARATAALGDTRDALLIAAVLVLAIGVLVLPLRRHQPPPELPGAPLSEPEEGAATGLRAIRGSRQLQLISALMVLGVMVAQIVDLQFNWAVQSATRGLDQRTAFFGNFFSVMGLSAFVFQLLFTARIHRTLGIGFSMRVLPGVVGLGTVGLLAATAFGPGGVVAAAMVLKIGENGIRYSFDQATRELLFLPVPSSLRARAKSFIDVFIQRGAKGLAALVLLPVTFGLFGALEAGWITLVLVALWLVVATLTFREYVRSFRGRLRQRAVDAEVPIDLTDATTLEILIQSLGSSDPRQILHSLDILSAHGKHALVPPVLLYHDDAEVRLHTLRILADAEREDAAHLVERRLSDPEPAVRAEAIRVLARLRREDACAMMLPRLAESEPGVRAAAVACVANLGDERLRRHAGEALEEMLSDASPDVRREAAKALGAMGEPLHRPALMQLLYDREPRVVREALAAIRARNGREAPSPIYLPTLISLLQARRLKHEARETLVLYGEAAMPALIHFMNDPEEPIWVRRAIPKTIARIESDAAVEALFAALEGQRDSFLRRKLYEALVLARPRRVPAARVTAEIQGETGRYLATLADLYGLRPRTLAGHRAPRVRWPDSEPEPSLLEQLLAERLEEHLGNLFRLLSLIHPVSHVRSAYHTLGDERPAVRGHTLEYLDNTLTGEVRRHVFAAIGDDPIEDKLEAARRPYGISPLSRPEVLRRFLAQPLARGSEEAFLVAAALYSVHSDRLEALYPKVEELRGAVDRFVRETADWVMSRAA